MRTKKTPKTTTPAESATRTKQPQAPKSRLNNPWTEQPVSTQGSFGSLNSIIQSHYGQQSKFRGDLHNRRKLQLSEAQSLVEDIISNSQIQIAEQKHFLHEKYKGQFDIVGKLVQMNNTIAFINSVRDIPSTQDKEYSSSYVKVPCESQSTFLKLFYRIGKSQEVQFTNSLEEADFRQVQQLKLDILSKLYI